MEKVLIVHPGKCTGCKQCELACSLARYGEFRPAGSNIRVLRNKEMDVNLPVWGVSCSFCEECVTACLPGALEFVPLDQAILKWKGLAIGSFPAPLIPAPGHGGAIL